MKILKLAIFLGLLFWQAPFLFAQKLTKDTILLQNVTILSTWANEKTPITYKNINKTALEKNNLGQDLPFLLNFTPSVVITSDAGAGVGYTGIRIRGSDPTRINVTINGIPLNDAESQGVYFVDLPDFASSTQNVQIQRGVGTSTNGAGAFGATINLNTASVEQKPSLILSNSVGSFNTLKNTITANSGVLGGHFTIDARLSRIISDGYIDRASSNLKSFYTSATYFDAKNSLRFNVFGGKEITYQAWDGVPAQYINDSKSRKYNVAGTEKMGEPYSNQVDNYTQIHYQAIYNHKFSSDFDANLSLHYTRGYGFYEQYKANQSFKKYNLTPDSLTSDLVRRLWLDNHFYGAIYNFRYHKGKWEATLGGGANQYLGKHYGEVIWTASSPNAQYRYYDNDATKNDFNIFGKINYFINNQWNTYIDLQYRQVNYNFLGYNRQQQNVTQQIHLPFFNPKLGVLFQQDKNKFYTAFGAANREPNRDDYTQSTPESRPKAETLYNGEIGYQHAWQNGLFNANFYYMYYKNQLALTGRINDVGAYIRNNLDKSYRTGLELDGSFNFSKYLTINANATFSRNKILHFTEYVDNWDTGAQEVVQHKNTNLGFSPNIIASGEIVYHVFNKNKQDLNLALLSKYVGKQFIDNTSNDEAALAEYFVQDFRIYYKLSTKYLKEITLTFLVNNIWNHLYESNAWVYRYRSDGYDPRTDDPYTVAISKGKYQQIGYFPQASRNILFGLNLKF